MQSAIWVEQFCQSVHRTVVYAGIASKLLNVQNSFTAWQP